MTDADISVACLVSKGVFMSDCSVKIDVGGKTVWQGLVDREMVVGISGKLLGEEYLQARMYGYLVSIDRGNNSALIELPVEGNSSGRRIYVPISIIRPEKQPA